MKGVRWVAGVACIALVGTAAGQGTEVRHSTGPLLNSQIEDMLSRDEESPHSPLERKLGAARGALEESDYATAFKRLREALEIDARDSRVFVLYALVHLEREEYASAELAVQKALEVNPYDAAAWHQHSRIQYLKGEYGIALEAARESVKLTANPQWNYFYWLGELLMKRDDYAAAEGRFAESHALLSDIVARVRKGIMQRESQREATGMNQDSELVINPLSGEVREVEVTRLTMDYKVAPERWYEFVAFFEKSLGEVAFARFRSLVELGREEEAKALLPSVFSGESEHGLRAFVVGDYAQALKELEPANATWRRTPLSQLWGYVVSQVAAGESEKLKRNVVRLERRLRKEAPWGLATLSYLGRYEPALSDYAKDGADSEPTAMDAFYRAQFHLAQGFPGLAIPLLESAKQAGGLGSFEAKAVEAQLALRGG